MVTEIANIAFLCLWSIIVVFGIMYAIAFVGLGLGILYVESFREWGGIGCSMVVLGCAIAVYSTRGIIALCDLWPEAIFWLM